MLLFSPCLSPVNIFLRSTIAAPNSGVSSFCANSSEVGLTYSTIVILTVLVIYCTYNKKLNVDEDVA
jgi:hypothetical protein